MNKDELLKIYSAYLPYGLLIETRTDEEIKTEGSYISKLTGVDHLGLYDEFANCWEFEVRPILYDLSYLTKEIENGIYVINDIADVISKDQGFSIINSDDAIILDFDEEYVFHIISTKNMMRQPYEIIQILLKYHFNVFNIPESEYINKATLTQKQ
ncbi:hypothetical protein ACVVIH_12980 [Chryseobacterium arthrosphaerae]|uniref:hypothetical protein n=1 Tax=Chryseobacterium arthrosphaerae TaxID=651561 RepID=UPI00241D14F1|nr:hypothetical protein [Chryseobacterium arthrosphaerae]